MADRKQRSIWYPVFLIVAINSGAAFLAMHSAAAATIEYSCASVLSNPGNDHLYLTVEDQEVGVTVAGVAQQFIKFKRDKNSNPVSQARLRFLAEKRSFALDSSLMNGGKVLANGREGGFLLITHPEGTTTDYVCVK